MHPNKLFWKIYTLNFETGEILHHAVGFLFVEKGDKIIFHQEKE